MIAGSLGKYRTRFYHISVSLYIDICVCKIIIIKFGTLRFLFKFGTLEIFVQILNYKKEGSRRDIEPAGSELHSALHTAALPCPSLLLCVD